MSVLFVFRALVVLEPKEKRYVQRLLKGEVKVTVSILFLPRDHKACSLVAVLWECLESSSSIDSLCYL